MRNGHCLYNESKTDLRHHILTDLPALPYLDGALLVEKGVKDNPDGYVYHGTLGGPTVLWHAFVWWDRSGDPRPSSHSGIYVCGYPVEFIDDAWRYGLNVWASIERRQLYPLKPAWREHT